MGRLQRIAIATFLMMVVAGLPATRAIASPPTMLQGLLSLRSGTCKALATSWAPQPGAIESIWRFEENAGATVLADSSGNGRTLTPQYGYSNSFNGKVGRALASGNTWGFSTTNSFVSPQTFTIAAWVKASSQQGGVITSFAEQRTGQPTGYDRHFGMTASGQFVFGVYDNGTIYSLTSPLSYNDGNWHHVALRYSSNSAQIFVDGVMVVSQLLSSAQYFTGYWRIAGGYISGWGVLQIPTEAWLGSIDEVAIFSVALTDGEISSLASSPAEVNASFSQWAQAVGVWHFSETSGAYQDSSPAANHITEPIIPRRVEGFFGSGTSGLARVLATSTTTTASPDVMTMSLWFRTTQPGFITQFANEQDNTAGAYDRLLVIQTNGTLAFGTYNGSSFTMTTSGASYTDGAWHHAVLTFQSGSQNLYVDGVNVATGTPSGAQSFAGYWLFADGNTAAWPITLSPNQLAADLDEVGFWRAILTPTEVLQLYNNQRCN